MIYKASQLPTVDPMMVRRFKRMDEYDWSTFRDKVLWMESEGNSVGIDVDEIGLAESRLPFDRDIVDQSHGVFEFTTDLMLRQPLVSIYFAIFTSCRWRNHRWEVPDEQGHTMRWPPPDEPLLFIGNPYVIIGHPGGACEVYREPSYLIRSGTSLQYDEPSS